MEHSVFFLTHCVCARLHQQVSSRKPSLHQFPLFASSLSSLCRNLLTLCFTSCVDRVTTLLLLLWFWEHTYTHTPSFGALALFFISFSALTSHSPPRMLDERLSQQLAVFWWNFETQFVQVLGSSPPKVLSDTALLFSDLWIYWSLLLILWLEEKQCFPLSQTVWISDSADEDEIQIESSLWFAQQSLCFFTLTVPWTPRLWPWWWSTASDSVRRHKLTRRTVTVCSSDPETGSKKLWWFKKRQKGRFVK